MLVACRRKRSRTARHLVVIDDVDVIDGIVVVVVHFLLLLVVVVCGCRRSLVLKQAKHLLQRHDAARSGAVIRLQRHVRACLRQPRGRSIRILEVKLHARHRRWGQAWPWPAVVPSLALAHRRDGLVVLVVGGVAGRRDRPADQLVGNGGADESDHFGARAESCRRQSAGVERFTTVGLSGLPPQLDGREDRATPRE